MSNQSKTLLTGFFFLLILSSCKKNDNSYKAIEGRSYYPTELGRYITYDVDSTLYDDFSGDTLRHHCQQRYTMADTFRDNQGRLSWIVMTSVRDTDTAAFVDGASFYVTPTSTGLDVVMENLRFTRLIFPVAEGLSWAGNNQIPTSEASLQYLSNWTYRYENVGQPYNNGSLHFDKTVTVAEQDETVNEFSQPGVYASRTFSKAVYADSTGMVYREIAHLLRDPGVSPFIGGYAVVMRAIDYH